MLNLYSVYNKYLKFEYDDPDEGESDFRVSIHYILSVYVHQPHIMPAAQVL